MGARGAAAAAVLAALALVGCGRDVPLDPAVQAGVDPRTTLDPRVIFRVSGGCGLCHELAAAGTRGQTGPNLDQALPGRSAADIRRSILQPGDRVEPGYPAAMPSANGNSLSPAQLDALVAWLQAETRR